MIKNQNKTPPLQEVEKKKNNQNQNKTLRKNKQKNIICKVKKYSNNYR